MSTTTAFPEFNNISSTNGSNSTHMPQMNAFANLALHILTVTEILAFIPTFPLVFLCSYLVLRTSVLHKNLKWILLAQNAQVFVFDGCRLFTVGQMYLFPSTYWNGARLIYCIIFGAIVFGNLIGHVLIIERILATIWVRKYENYQHWGFTIGWLLITLSLTIVNSIAYYQFDLTTTSVSLIIMYTHIVAMLASLVEIFIMSSVTYLNIKQFSLDVNAPTVHPLTVRYQLTENIRTGKQLAPTFFCHFVSVTLSFLVIINGYVHFIDEFNTMMVAIGFAFVIHAFNNFAILATVIRCHPMLNRQARRLFRHWRKLPGCLQGPSLAPHRVAPSRNSIPSIDVCCPLPVETHGGSRYLHLISQKKGGEMPKGGGGGEKRSAEKQKQQQQVNVNANNADAYFLQLHRAWGDYLH